MRATLYPVHALRGEATVQSGAWPSGRALERSRRSSARALGDSRVSAGAARRPVETSVKQLSFPPQARSPTLRRASGAEPESLERLFSPDCRALVRLG